MMFSNRFFLTPFLFLFFLAVFIQPSIALPQLHLNEIVASNASGLEDEDGDTEDWIEIYNSGDTAIHLEGFGLSDDYDRPFRWEFPDVSIQPGEFMVIWASGKDRKDPQSELHTNYRISSAGEEVLLTTPDGERIDELPPTPIPTDISLGRYPDGTGDWYFYTSPTPGAPNTSDGYQELLDPVEFSVEGGFHSGDLTLTLSHPDPDAVIIYTLDGSEPSPDNLDGVSYPYMHQYRDNNFNTTERHFRSRTYESPIQITDRTSEPNYMSEFQTFHSDQHRPWQSLFKGTVVRARAFKGGAVSVNPKTHTYFITPQQENRYSLPVISIAIQEDHLFDYNTGIHVPGRIFDEENPWGADGGANANYHQRGIEWERPASLELFEPDNPYPELRQNMGIRIHGGWSRGEPQKSLRLYARNMYGESRFNHQMFPELPYASFNRVMLRNSGNDFNRSLFRDAAMQRVVEHMKCDTQAYRPFVIFLNGEYWGIMNMRERYDRHYLARVHGVNPDNVDILTSNAVVKEGDNTHYNETLEYMQDNDMSDPDHYAYIQTRIDTDNYIDYLVAQLYVNNSDWPGNNIDFWRYRTDEYQPDAPPQHDGRWRWLIFDMDFGFHLYGGSGHYSSQYNMIRHVLGLDQHAHGNPEWSTRLPNYLFENEQFTNDFITRYMDQLNTAFRPSRVKSILEEMAAHIEPDRDDQFVRWGSGWEGIGHMERFANERPEVARRHIREHFLPSTSLERRLTVDVSDPAEGHIRVNTIDITPETPGVDENPWPWSGTYFTQRDLTLKAEPSAGFLFSHWEGNIGDADPNDPEITFTMTGNHSVTAIFEPGVSEDLFPDPHYLISGAYEFSYWAPDAIGGTYPDHMAFVYMDELDPGIDANVEGFTNGVYSYSSRTRVNGLNDNGFAFINTSNEEGNPGYPGVRLGGALLAINTIDVEDITVSWDGMTVRPNSRVYNLRLQYRIGDTGPFTDVKDGDGQPVEYARNNTEGHRQTMGPVTLPSEVEEQAYVQLLWRYYYTGEQLDEDSGQRTKLAVPQIMVTPKSIIASEADPVSPNSYELMQNYPNPFNPMTSIRYALPVESQVRIEVFDVMGRLVETLVNEHQRSGVHHVTWDASEMASGIYLYRITTGDFMQTKRMTLLR
ncbi:CotH kinase family protein [Balneolaceae bacterium ANBcel3]|nr:CotH kinase family protein [Balneolaceae bacterium ANBcel3]